MATEMKDDLLRSASEIADFLGQSERATYNLLENDLIPAFKIGAKWHARKSVLERHYGGDTGG